MMLSSGHFTQFLNSEGHNPLKTFFFFKSKNEFASRDLTESGLATKANNPTTVITL